MKPVFKTYLKLFKLLITILEKLSTFSRVAIVKTPVDSRKCVLGI